MTQHLEDIHVVITQTAIIILEIGGLPRPNVNWLFNGSPLQPSTKHKPEIKGNQIILNINKTDLSDSGVYTAALDNGVEKLEVPTKVNVGGKWLVVVVCGDHSEITHACLIFLVKPKVEAAKPANEQSCVIGQDTQISWKFSGIEKPQVTWLFNGQPVTSSDRVQISESEDGTSTLSIRAAELTDKGVYTAKATNAVGEAEAKPH